MPTPPRLASPRLALLALAAAAPLAAPAAAQVPISAETFVTGLERPVGLVAAPDGSDRLMVPEQFSGRVRVIESGVLLEQPFLDLGGQVAISGERGLLGLAFHPDFATNGRLFVQYNDLVGDVVVEEYHAAPGAAAADPASGQRLLTVAKPFVQHNGGALQFLPDGTLLVSLGDGGSGFDPLDHAQDLGSLLGKLLRIDVDAPPEPPLAYAVPPDNPYVGVPGARGEVFAYGLRNPWRVNVDPATGDVWIGDVGQEQAEELDLVPAGTSGQNFGWRCLEGDQNTQLCHGAPPALADPVLVYDHDEGCAVVGGPVYRGAALPGLVGTTFYADHCTGRVWSFVWDGAAVTQLVERTAEIPGFQDSISSFGVDAEGELYVVYYVTGEVRKIVPPPPVLDCDGDGTPDAEELAAGTAFDVNGDGVPDECQHLLVGTDLVVGSPVTFEFFGALPSQPVVYLYSLRGIGPGWCFYDGAVCLDIPPYLLGGVPTISLLGLDLANAQGHSVLGFVMPAFEWPSGIGFQAVALDGKWSAKSNPLQKVVQQP